MTDLLPGRASGESTGRYAKRFSDAAPEHFRHALGLTLGSIGMGTYLGNPDVETDDAYARSMASAVERGCNVIDSAANYRFQRSERSIGDAMRRLAKKGITREEIILCTKGGFIPFDGDIPAHPPGYFTETFIKPGIAVPGDLVGGRHCMTPKYLSHQIDCSRKNLGVETIDIYYIHNPETQLDAVPREEFYSRIRLAFEMLERAALAGKISLYGCSTWNAFRHPPESPEHISLEKLVGIAQDIAGNSHKFRVIQMPYNISMSEALKSPSQELNGMRVPALTAAAELGLTVFTSVPIFQGRLLFGLPDADDFAAQFPNTSTGAQRALQFVRSTPGVTAPLIGMSSPGHVEENLSLLKIAPLTPGQFSKLMA